MNFNGMGMGFGGFWMFAILILSIVLVLWLVKSMFTQPNQSQSESAMETLRKRYAKGEIDQAEFEQKKKDLQAQEYGA